MNHERQILTTNHEVYNMSRRIIKWTSPAIDINDILDAHVYTLENCEQIQCDCQSPYMYNAILMDTS